MPVEYRVKEIKRYIVTRYQSTENTGSSSEVSTYSSGEMAYQVAYALCRQEHINSGEPIDSMTFIYPSIPDGVSVEPQ